MSHPAVASFYAQLGLQLEGLKEAQLYKHEEVITSPQGGRIRILVDGAERELVNLCSNNYLGLANHPRIVQAAAQALESFGFGLSSVRFICGTQVAHKALEDRLSGFLGLEDTILFPSCFDANAGFFEVFLDEEDHIISDRLNHASIIDGIRLCKAGRSVYANGDLAELEVRLQESAGARRRLIVTDGVFSMDGVIAPLPGIRDLADRYGALVYVDDSHGIGAIGPTGGGALEHHQMAGGVDFVAGTLGKALGGASGGFISGRREAIALLRQRARPYLFSNSIPPPIAVAASVALDILQEEPERLLKLRLSTETLRRQLTSLGFRVLGDGHPIVPVAIGDAVLTARLGAALRDEGVHAVPFSHPVVPHNQARIRLQVSAAHTPEDLDIAVRAFAKAGRALGLIS